MNLPVYVPALAAAGIALVHPNPRVSARLRRRLAGQARVELRPPHQVVFLVVVIMVVVAELHRLLMLSRDADVHLVGRDTLLVVEHVADCPAEPLQRGQGKEAEGDADALARHGLDAQLADGGFRGRRDRVRVDRLGQAPLKHGHTADEIGIGQLQGT